MPRNMRKGLYKIIYLVKGRRAAVPATLQFDAAMREFAALKRRGFTAWIETDSGEFVPVEGAMRKPKEIVDEQRRHRVADFSTLPELIEHAKMVDGASHILIRGQQVQIFFPLDNGRYDAGTVWQDRGYWHAPAKSARTVVTRLPADAEPIGSHVQRVGKRAGEAPTRRRAPQRADLRRGAKTALELAGELSQKVGGTTPKTLPDGFRWNEQNEAAQFTTHSPEYGQKVVVVVSTFPDRSVAVDYFGNEGLSETDRYESVGHNTYKSTADLPEMVNDIRWVWETVDRYAASWQEDEGGEVEEARAKIATMYQEARVFINGRFQVGFTFTPQRGPADAARTVLQHARSGDVIDVKQEDEVWTYDVTRHPGKPATIVERTEARVDPHSRATATANFDSYVKDSKRGYGRASGEDVTLLEDGEPIREHFGRQSGMDESPRHPVVRDYIAVDPSGRHIAGPFTDYDRAKREADRARGYVRFASKVREDPRSRRPSATAQADAITTPLAAQPPSSAPPPASRRPPARASAH